MWFARVEVAPGVWRTEEPGVDPMFRACMVTVRGRDADLQFDFGCGVHPLRPALHVSGAPVIAVASHAHVDHIGGFHEFADRRGHAAEAAGFAGMPGFQTFADEFRLWPGGPATAPLPADWQLHPAPLTGLLAEGDVIDLGGPAGQRRCFTVLHLPGHSPGGIGLLESRTGLLLAGDAIYDDDILDDLPGANRTDYAFTMQRLLALDCRMVIGGHGPVMTRARMQSVARAYLAGASLAR